jgi:cytochrome b involved in lipid metabolism
MDTYTKHDIMSHNTTDSCWIVIDAKVYDVTSYLKRNLHPGGNDLLLKYAGDDATSNFSDIHSKNAWYALEEYYIGKVMKDSKQVSYFSKIFKYLFNV